MLEKLEAIKKKWKEIEQKMNEPSAMANMKLFIKLNKDYKDLQPIVEGYDKLSLIVNNIESAKDVLNNEKDEEFRSLAKEELSVLIPQREELEEKLRLMLIPKTQRIARTLSLRSERVLVAMRLQFCRRSLQDVCKICRI